MVIFQIILFIIILNHTHTTQRNARGTRYALSLTQWLSLRSDKNKTNPTDNRCALWTEDIIFFSPFVTCVLYERTVDNRVRHVETFPLYSRQPYSVTFDKSDTYLYNIAMLHIIYQSCSQSWIMIKNYIFMKYVDHNQIILCTQ